MEKWKQRYGVLANETARKALSVHRKDYFPPPYWPN